MPERATRQRAAEREVSRGHSSPNRDEGPNEREGGTPVSLEGARSQMSRQLELPLAGRGEAPRSQRSEKASTAASGDGRSGTNGLMKEVVQPRNLRAALKRVRQNKGSPGVDGMTVEELPEWLRANWPEVREQLLEGRYRPQPVERQTIPKSGGGKRELGIPSVLDRFIQQALLQVLQPRFDPTFSMHSHGFRPGRRAHDAVCEAQGYVQERCQWVVDVDLEKFFDRVNHDVLMGRLADRIEDKLILGLIRRYLEAGVMCNGVVVERHEGTPQGGPLSPLLANVLLDEVDKELERRGHRFVRYADDCNVYVKSRRAGERVMRLLRRLYARLRLRVNEAKSAIARARSRKFLGFAFWVGVGKRVRRRVSRESLTAMKARVRRITKRNSGRSLEQVAKELKVFLTGWMNYFRLADTPKVFRELDEWIRHRLRALQLKHWRRGKTVYRELRARGMSKGVASQVAGNTRRWWHNSAIDLNIALPNKLFDELGVPRLAGGPQPFEPPGADPHAGWCGRGSAG